MTYHEMPLQREADLTALAPEEPAQWPAFMHQRPRAEERGLRILQDFHRSAESAYQQSHPYEQMFTGASLAADQVMLNNNYMKAIFGGEPAADDNIQMAYDHTVRQMAEAPIEKGSIISQQNPLAFVPVGEASKDSMLQAFADERQFYAGAVDSDADRALKSRATHRLVSTTFYGKKLSADGTSLRNNHVRGQNDLIFRPEKLENFRPYENLSSKTYAPDGQGGEVPLSATAVYDVDPREVPVPGAGAAPAVVNQTDFTDFGIYAGAATNAFAPLPDAGIAMLFEDNNRRM
jgi:hypothetical protein